MTLEYFTKNYYCICDIINHDNTNLEITSRAFGIKENKVVDSVKTVIEIQQAKEWIMDSQTKSSIIQWDWNKLIDETKRAHLDFFSQRAPIVDFYPLNRQDNPDISIFYKQ